MARRSRETPEPVTLGHIRGHGCRDLLVYCASTWCHHGATLNADWLPDETVIRALCPRMVCTACELIGADVRPDWSRHTNGRPHPLEADRRTKPQHTRHPPAGGSDRLESRRVPYCIHRKGTPAPCGSHDNDRCKAGWTTCRLHSGGPGAPTVRRNLPRTSRSDERVFFSEIRGPSSIYAADPR